MRKLVERLLARVSRWIWIAKGGAEVTDVSTIDVIRTLSGGSLDTTPIRYEDCPSCGIRFKKMANIDRCWSCRNGRIRITRNGGKVVNLVKRGKS